MQVDRYCRPSNAVQQTTLYLTGRYAFVLFGSFEFVLSGEIFRQHLADLPHARLVPQGSHSSLSPLPISPCSWAYLSVLLRMLVILRHKPGCTVLSSDDTDGKR